MTHQDQIPLLQKAAASRNVTPDRVARAVDRVEEARMLALGNVNPQLLVSTLLLDLEEALVG